MMTMKRTIIKWAEEIMRGIVRGGKMWMDEMMREMRRRRIKRVEGRLRGKEERKENLKDL